MSTEEPDLLTLPAGPETEFTEMISISIICRLCANQSDKLIGIYSEDGINNDLAGKMNLYLPIKVTDTDNLPLQCCWQCASTVLAWHDLVITSVEADRRLRSYQFVTDKQLQEITSYGVAESSLSNTMDVNLVVDPKEPVNFTSLNEVQLRNVDISSKSEEVIDKKSDVSQANKSFLDHSDIIDDDNLISRKENISYSTPSDYKNESQSIQSSVQEETLETLNNVEKGGENSETSDTEEESMYNFECPICPTLFITEVNVRLHLKEEHPDINDEEVFFNTNESEDQEEQNEKDTSKKSQGRRSFSVKHMMKRPHQKIDQDVVNKAKVVVEGKIFYKCKECGKCLHSPYTYVWHTRIHTGERPYVCDLCGKQFRVSQGLVRHLKETHERIKNFDCDICGRFFATRRNVEEHRRIHTNERPYVCDLCGKAFKQKASLFVHNRSHSTSFPFKCSYCPQKFRTKQSLLIHVTRHTGEKPFPCDVCGRCFRIKYELKRHKLIHSEEKPFSCKICGQTFRQKRYLRNHLKLNHQISNPGDLIDSA